MRSFPAVAALSLLLGLSCRPAVPEGGEAPLPGEPAPDAGGAVDAGGEQAPADAGAEVDAGRDAGAEVDAGWDASTPPPDAGPAFLSAVDYCESIAPFFCDFYLRCGRMVAATAAECRSLFLESCNAKYEPRYEMLEDAGMLRLSAVGVEACRSHLSAVACSEQPSDLFGPCGEQWRGTRPASSKCGFDVESLVCEPGTSCRLSLSLCGTCEAHLPLGGACGDGGRCDPEAQCLDGVCTRRALPGKPCDAQRRCIVGATCTSGGVCQGPAWVGLNQPCDAQRRCPYGASCLSGSCRASSRLGGPCGPLTACSTGFCAADAGVCVELLPLGASCTGPTACQSGYCVAGTCARIPGACF